MAPKNEIERHKDSAPVNPIVFGALAGAGAGIVAAMLLRRRAQKYDRDSMMTPTEAIQIGLLVFGLFRAIASLGDDD
jgi:hypothetical protein